ncbi:hypothetical protein GH733_004723, partial [Mirounga leonina]
MQPFPLPTVTMVAMAESSAFQDGCLLISVMRPHLASPSSSDPARASFLSPASMGWEADPASSVCFLIHIMVSAATSLSKLTTETLNADNRRDYNKGSNHAVLEKEDWGLTPLCSLLAGRYSFLIIDFMSDVVIGLQYHSEQP